ncbi:hypothetical protein DOTSEDRAFT_24585 [Dothistroma septosporum NZE10]|uniref:Uncharacterized protein n=1 Tax=Dothistroma septosporum (strain NZE10 / CBS 128990) TaxID=675120 RepID=N1PQ61_DOTSN|nr:hypothetical protein DOTSEDRAFT_24585 [Dothistroma septosporum NZE10]
MPPVHQAPAISMVQRIEITRMTARAVLTAIDAATNDLTTQEARNELLGLIISSGNARKTVTVDKTLRAITHTVESLANFMSRIGQHRKDKSLPVPELWSRGSSMLRNDYLQDLGLLRTEQSTRHGSAGPGSTERTDDRDPEDRQNSEREAAALKTGGKEAYIELKSPEFEPGAITSPRNEVPESVQRHFTLETPNDDDESPVRRATTVTKQEYRPGGPSEDGEDDEGVKAPKRSHASAQLADDNAMAAKRSRPDTLDKGAAQAFGSSLSVAPTCADDIVAPQSQSQQPGRPAGSQSDAQVLESPTALAAGRRPNHSAGVNVSEPVIAQTPSKSQYRPLVPDAQEQPRQVTLDEVLHALQLDDIYPPEIPEIGKANSRELEVQKSVQAIVKQTMKEGHQHASNFAVNFCAPQGLEESVPAKFVQRPGPELRRLYQQIFGSEHWQRKLLERQNQHQPFIDDASHILTSLIAADVFLRVFNERQPWDLEHNVKMAAGEQIEFCKQASLDFGYQFDEILKQASFKMMDDDSFQEHVVAEYAKALAEDLAMTLSPHLLLLRQSQRPEDNARNGPGNTSEWIAHLEEVIQTALVLKGKIQTYNEADFEFVWPKVGELMRREECIPLSGRVNFDVRVMLVEWPGLKRTPKAMNARPTPGLKAGFLPEASVLTRRMDM